MVDSPLVCRYIRNEHVLGSNCRTAGFFQRGQGGAAAPPELRRCLLPFIVKYT